MSRKSNKPCVFFFYGRCRNGDQCKFHHDTSLTVKPKKLENPCIYYPFGPLFVEPITINFHFGDSGMHLYTFETFDLLSFRQVGYPSEVVCRVNITNENMILAIHQKETQVFELIYEFYHSKEY
jgi:hypothetical protein